jgi:hypothetical protein
VIDSAMRRHPRVAALAERTTRPLAPFATAQAALGMPSAAQATVLALNFADATRVAAR